MTADIKKKKESKSKEVEREVMPVISKGTLWADVVWEWEDGIGVHRHSIALSVLKGSA